MAADPRELTYLYVLGRQDDELDLTVDLTVIAERVMAGGSLREVTYEVAKVAATAAEQGGYERDWCLEYADEVKEAGIPASTAYKLYIQGRIDELAHNLESEVLAEVVELLGDIEHLRDNDDDKDDEGNDEEEGEDEDEDEGEEPEDVDELGEPLEESPPPALAEAKVVTKRRSRSA